MQKPDFASVSFGKSDIAHCFPDDNLLFHGDLRCRRRIIGGCADPEGVQAARNHIQTPFFVKNSQLGQRHPQRQSLFFTRGKNCGLGKILQFLRGPLRTVCLRGQIELHDFLAAESF